MQSHKIQETWDETKAEIKKKWTHLADSDVEALKGRLSRLKGLIQSTYGYAKERAEREFNDFKREIEQRTDEAERKQREEAAKKDEAQLRSNVSEMIDNSSNVKKPEGTPDAETGATETEKPGKVA